jgi:hypothetical protein
MVVEGIVSWGVERTVPKKRDDHPLGRRADGVAQKANPQ